MEIGLTTCVALVKSSRNQKNNVVNHIAISNDESERRQRISGEKQNKQKNKQKNSYVI